MPTRDKEFVINEMDPRVLNALTSWKPVQDSITRIEERKVGENTWRIFQMQGSSLLSAAQNGNKVTAVEIDIDALTSHSKPQFTPETLREAAVLGLM